MGTILDYVHEFGKYTFLEAPFNEVDSLVLCQLAYLDYAKYVPGLDKRNAPVAIGDIYASPGWKEILESYWFREDNAALFAAAAESARFGTLKLNYYVNIINEAQEAQFSAITFVLEDKNSYLAYRGTDATIIGWKEDCNLAFSKPLHSHKLSTEYMDRVAGYIGGDFLAGGHSKGGNLAVYAAMNCMESTRNKLLRVYNNDGPGFRPEILEEGNYREVQDRIYKFIPKSSVVGVILQSEGEYEVVESKGIGMLQHNAYFWKVEGAAFVRAEGRTDFKAFRDAAFNEWILSLSDEDKHAFVDTLYEVVSASEAKNLFELGADWKSSLQGMSEAIKGLDENTGKAIRQIVRAGFEIAGGMVTAEFKSWKQEMKQELKEWKEEHIQKKK